MRAGRPGATPTRPAQNRAEYSGRPPESNGGAKAVCETSFAAGWRASPFFQGERASSAGSLHSYPPLGRRSIGRRRIRAAIGAKSRRCKRADRPPRPRIVDVRPQAADENGAPHALRTPNSRRRRLSPSRDCVSLTLRAVFLSRIRSLSFPFPRDWERRFGAASERGRRGRLIGAPVASSPSPFSRPRPATRLLRGLRRSGPLAVGQTRISERLEAPKVHRARPRDHHGNRLHPRRSGPGRPSTGERVTENRN